jgi:hypothetical protein
LWSDAPSVLELTDIVDIWVSGSYHNFEKLSALVTADMGTRPTGRRYLQGDRVVLTHADEHPDWRNRVIAAAQAVIDQSAGGQRFPIESALHVRSATASLEGQTDFGEVARGAQ